VQQRPKSIGQRFNGLRFYQATLKEFGSAPGRPEAWGVVVKAGFFKEMCIGVGAITCNRDQLGIAGSGISRILRASS
jgi:hypothetical protein